MASFGFSVPGTRAATRPFTSITSSLRKLCDCLGQLGVFFRPKNNLGQTFAIAQIDEDHAAVVARTCTQPARVTCWPISAREADCSDESGMERKN